MNQKRFVGWACTILLAACRSSFYYSLSLLFFANRVWYLSRVIQEAVALLLQGRDVFNEKPAEEEIIDTDAAAAAVLPAAATLHTTLGDIVIKLQGELCPRTVENFATHSKNGYFDTILFHRIIKNFMIQTGGTTLSSRESHVSLFLQTCRGKAEARKGIRHNTLMRHSCSSHSTTRCSDR